jgi:hypothetical protein
LTLHFGFLRGSVCSRRPGLEFHRLKTSWRQIIEIGECFEGLAVRAEIKARSPLPPVCWVDLDGLTQALVAIDQANPIEWANELAYTVRL